MELYVQRRVQKETRYNPIIDLVVNLLEDLFLKEKYVRQAEENEIKPLKNYRIIFLGISLIEQELLVNRGWTNKNILEWVFGYIYQNIDETVENKYQHCDHSAQLIKQTIQKNMKDLIIIQYIFCLQKYDNDLMEKQLKGFYKTKQDTKVGEILDVIMKFRNQSFKMYNQKHIEQDEAMQAEPTQIEQNMQEQNFIENQDKEIEIVSIQGGYTRFWM